MWLIGRKNDLQYRMISGPKTVLILKFKRFPRLIFIEFLGKYSKIIATLHIMNIETHSI